MSSNRLLAVTEKDGEGVGPDPVEFFCRHARGDCDLLKLQVDEDLFCGRLHEVAIEAKSLLSQRSSKQVKAILGICDTWLTLLIDESVPVKMGGKVAPLTRELLPNLEPMSILPYAAMFADGLSLCITDVDDSEYAVDDISAAETCAAFALSQVAASTRYEGVDWELSNGAFHAMYASQAWGLAMAFGSGSGDSFIELAARRSILEKMRNAGRKRWEEDSTQVLKREAYRRWCAWNMDRRKLPKPKDFRNSILRDFPDAVDGTLKNWMSDWSKSRNVPDDES